MTGEIVNILSNVLANLIFFLLGYSVNFMNRHIKQRFFRKLWRPLLNEKSALLIFSTRYGDRPWNTPKISFTEAEAYEEVHRLFKQLGIDLELERSNAPLEGELFEKVSSKNVIILGSPVANPICQKVWEELKKTGHPFKFYIENPEKIFYRENREKVEVKMNLHYFEYIDKYFPELNPDDLPYEDRRWVSDYGIIVRCENPFNENKKMILAMGCHGFSTYGAMHMMTDSKWVKDLLDITQNRDSITFVKFNLIENRVTSKKIMFNYDITSRELKNYLHSN